jgi:hypothetical protein
MDEEKQNRCRQLRVRFCLTIGCFVRLGSFSEGGSARLSQVVILTFDICYYQIFDNSKKHMISETYHEKIWDRKYGVRA